jgi:Rap1a immunity proteins
MHPRLMIAALLTIASAQLHAGELMTAGKLQEFCSSKDAAIRNACRFYILGVSETLMIAKGVGADKARPCIPDGLPEADMVAAYQKAVAVDFVAFPQDRDLPAVSMLSAVMLRAYPCKE